METTTTPLYITSLEWQTTTGSSAVIKYDDRCKYSNKDDPI